MKKPVRLLMFAGLFIFSFLFFLYLTFPYEVLKETIAAQVSKETGYSIQIGSMGPDLPIGVSADQVRVADPSGTSSVTLDNLTIELGLLSTLLGRVSSDVMVTIGEGKLHVVPSWPILQLLRENLTPRYLEVEATAFPIDQITAFGLSAAANMPDANPMLTPIISAIGLVGKLNANINLDLDGSNPASSSGNAQIALQDAVLQLSDPSLGLPDQAFGKALIKADIVQGNLVVDKSSGFVSEELELLLDGKVALRPQISASPVDLNIVFSLNKGLKEKFGFIVDAMTGKSASDGRITMQVKGPLGRPALTTI